MLFHIVEKKKRSRPMSPKAQLEQEKRLRREIANSNERRRMQCINAGFQGLRALMPQLSGEKLSKAAILQHTKEYIAKKEQELKQAKTQNEQLKRMLMEVSRDRDLAERQNETPPPKRKKRDTECSDEGIVMCEPSSEGSKDVSGVEDLHRELMELRQQLERERMLRMMMEERARALEAQLVHGQPRISPPLIPSSLPSPINLKVESPVSKPACNVQEISAHEDRIQSELAYNPKPRRNLENLVEAIRQIEGDRVLGDDSKYLSSGDRHSVLNCSEESEKESSVSDPEESKSEGSGRDSPSPLGLCARSLAMSASAVPSTPQAAHQGILSEKYPIASHLLHRPPYYRPGVIVHKS
ncbi:uncharacterized protein LOC143298880 isoform X2 [Babylonia areolata]|uniref:uncharacterized protein LOC143298880 isoform X2 n=1 Tax=Babylonia areolata TaxID=304850 RepID=UPI003FD4CC1E